MLKRFNAHWFARLLGCNVSHFEISKKHISIQSKDNLIKFELSNLERIPKLHNGIIFQSIEIDKKIFWGFSKNDITSIYKTIYRAWYEYKFEPAVDLVNLVENYLTNSYARTSKFQKILESAKYFHHTFKKIPNIEIVGPEIIKPFHYIHNLINNSDSILKSSRSKFLEIENIRFKNLFDSVESNPLTDRQRDACIKEEDNNLVLAGAGTGKTSTMVGKAAYLIESNRAKPEEILLLAFGDIAAKELQERLDARIKDAPIKASTFHKIGKSILSRVEGRSLAVSELATDGEKLDKYVDDLLKNLLMKEEYQRKAITYFKKYLYPDANPFDFKTMGEYFEYLETNDIRSFKNDIVKSHGELIIANFLFANGIEYEYEANYKVQTYTVEFQQYRPDFYLPEYNIYIEHYGIDRNKNTAPWISAEKYNNGIEWKRKLHQDNSTVCLETFHYEKMEGTLEQSLRAKLEKHMVIIECLPNESVLSTLEELGQVQKLSKLLSQLLENIKSSCKTKQEAFAKATTAKNSEQALAALDLLLPIFDSYNQKLAEEKEIDFNDMIHRAVGYVADGTYTPHWKYILVDEFQDISKPRAELIKTLRDKSENCVLFCVGDDWQAIYRFTGSDINFTTSFESYFGVTATTMLDITYRFNNSICDNATLFVTQNPVQKKKKLETISKVTSSAIEVYRRKNSVSIENIAEVLSKIDKLTEGKAASVYVISRYKFLVNKSDLAVTTKRYPSLNIQSLSMHASKGKEADYVIIVGLEKGKNGFPSEKITHPLLELFLPPAESFDHAEERRLFYVAITRAKKRVFLIADMSKPSPFMIEILKNKSYDLHINEEITSLEQVYFDDLSCATCGTGKLVLRKNNQSGHTFVGCSNYSRCVHTESSCPSCSNIMRREGNFKVCLQCQRKTPMCVKCNGEMRQRAGTGHWGCSNYRGKSKTPSCTYQQNKIEF